MNSIAQGRIRKEAVCLAVNMSRNANEQGRFEEVKTRLTTKREGECERERDIIHSVVRLVVLATRLDSLT